MQILTTPDAGALMAALSHVFGGEEGVRYDQRIARHCLWKARETLGAVWHHRDDLYPIRRRYALASVRRCRAALRRLDAERATWANRSHCRGV